MLKKIVCTCLCISAILSIVGCSSEQDAMKKVQEEQRTPVEVINITKGSIIKTDIYSEEIQPIQEVVVNSKTPGKVEEVNFDIGDQVSKDSILFVMDKKDIKNQLESLQSQLVSATASFDFVKENFENMKILYSEGAVSKQQYEQMKTDYEQTKASKDSLEIQIKNTYETLEDLEVRSPIDGIVAARNIEAGEIAGTGLSPFTILNIDTVYIDVNVPETLINGIQVNKEVEVKIEAVQEAHFKGIISRISPISDKITHTYPVRVEISNQEQRIKPGMFAEVIFELEKKEAVVTVPKKALVKLGEQWHAFIVKENIACQVPIQIGLDNGMVVEVKEGLKEGQQLIIKGKEYVKDGELVEIVNQ